MGMTDNQKRLIRAVAENDIRNAKKCAIACLSEDTTQKNQSFVNRYRTILTSEGANLFELPSDLREILVCEDVSLTFREDRYFLTEEKKRLAEKIVKMSRVSQKLMEMAIPYKNASLLYGAPGTGKTLFGKYIAYKLGLPFCYLNFSRTVDSYMGATSKNIAKAFSYAASNPCVFMLDEVDTISCNRAGGMSGAEKEIGRVTITLLQEFDKLPNDVIVIAATNRVDLLDEAFISRCAVREKFKPFSDVEKRAMVEKYLLSINMSIEESEMATIMKESSQRDITNAMIQCIAAKIAERWTV